MLRVLAHYGNAQRLRDDMTARAAKDPSCATFLAEWAALHEESERQNAARVPVTVMPPPTNYHQTVVVTFGGGESRPSRSN
jgi:hypothetical protein